MKTIITTLVFLFVTALSQAQTIAGALEKYNRNTVPYITVQDLESSYEAYTILDTRKIAEYEISHLPGAIWVGEVLDVKNLKDIDKSKPIVVYCTIGVRSENYGEQLLKNGFSDVKNLHGSIFSWKDAGFKLVDLNNKETDKVHTYSKEWSKYLKTGKKVY